MEPSRLNAPVTFVLEQITSQSLLLAVAVGESFLSFLSYLRARSFTNNYKSVFVFIANLVFGFRVTGAGCFARCVRA